MDFFEHAGVMVLGSRLRQLSERLTEDAQKFFQFYGVDIQAKWFPILYVLIYHESLPVTEIATMIRHSHPNVSQIAKEMKKAGVIEMKKCEKDGRVNRLSLSDKGRQITEHITGQFEDVRVAVEDLFTEINHDLWSALADLERVLNQKDFFSRVKDLRKKRVQSEVEILNFAPEYKKAFKEINYQWIKKYFEVEEQDVLALEHPEEKILSPGGAILVVKYQNEVVGVVALIKMDNDTYELAKMGITESARGLGIGYLLGKASIEKAKELGGKTIYLESNTILKPAINLYYKLGFKRIYNRTTPYERCNIQMELNLE